MIKTTFIVFICVIILILIISYIQNSNNKKEPFFNISNLYAPANASSIWRNSIPISDEFSDESLKTNGNASNKLKVAYEDKYYNTTKFNPETPSPPHCVCPKCPDCVCPKCPDFGTCPSDESILRKYGFIGPNIHGNQYVVPPLVSPRTIMSRPIGYNGHLNSASQYQLVGYLHKLGSVSDRDNYKILPVYGKEYRGNFFKYYTQYISGDQPFRKMIFKPPANDRDYSRELYDGDKVTIGAPLNAVFEYKEEKLDNRIDLFDEDPFY
jgi:hypothetical protein